MLGEGLLFYVDDNVVLDGERDYTKLTAGVYVLVLQVCGKVLMCLCCRCVERCLCACVAGVWKGVYVLVLQVCGKVFM
jgi:hypothetical protein